MSKRRKLRDIEEQKCLLVTKANLQRSTLLMLTSPIFRVVQAAEVGFVAMRVGKSVARHTKH